MDNIATMTETEQVILEVQGELIYCANCLHAKEKIIYLGGKKYKVKVRCQARKWYTKENKESLIDLSSIHRKIVKNCSMYMPMGDLHPFLEDLREDLPERGMLYDRK